jgi:peptide/nickel transport system substrate-binding protein
MSEQDNVEWQLADLVDAISAEVDRAEDTLALKSYARKVSFAIKKIALDVEVTMRRTPDGRLLFRSVDAAEESGTVLKLDFAQVLESQLAGWRRPLDDSTTSAPVSMLPGITAEEARALNGIAIFTVDDFFRYTLTAAMVAEVSRKTGIAESRVRLWRELPFLSAIKPEQGLPGSSVVLEGGNFGPARPEGTEVLFHGHPAKVLEWSNGRVTVQSPPQAMGPGLVFMMFGPQPTNLLTWEGSSMDLRVEDLVTQPEAPVSDEPFLAEALLFNRGTLPTQPFDVQWFLNDEPLEPQPHSPLPPGQRSSESGTRHELQLSPGEYTLRFVADCHEKMPELERALLTFSRTLRVREPQRMLLADFRMRYELDPVLEGPVDGSHVLGLIFRGLARKGPKGMLFPDLAAGWTLPVLLETDQGPLYSVTVTLRPDMRFHDGTPITVEDVLFTFQRMRQEDTPWFKWASRIHDITASEDQVTFLLYTDNALLPLLPAGIIPWQLYESDPEHFRQHPVGSGPFRVESFSPEKTELRAFRGYHRGVPRLDRLTLLAVPSLDELGERMLNRDFPVAVMPFEESWYRKLLEHGEWTVTRVVTPAQELMHVQVPDVLERAPADPDMNGNAHLWYLKS